MHKIARLIGFTILAILLVIGLIGSFFAGSIEAALKVPTKNNAAPATVGVTTTAGMIPGTKSTPQSISPKATNIVARDTFQRADQAFWGTATDGQVWGTDAANKSVFSIAGKTGQVANGQGTFNATLGPTATDAEAQFSGSMNVFHLSNLGVVLRWTDTNNWYKAYIDGANLLLLKKVAGMVTRLAAFPFVAKGGVAYTLRFRAVGTNLAAKVWRTGTPEPANWMITASDTALQNGLGGIRLILANGVVAKITFFQETTGV